MAHVRRFAAAVCFLSALSFFVDSTSAAAFKQVREGDEAPAFSLPDTSGTLVDLAAYHGDGPLTILVFWALWSPKSAPQLTDVQKLMDEFGAKGLKALAVNAEGAEPVPDLAAKVTAFAQEHGLTFPMVLDTGLDQYNNWGVIALPATAFLGKDRKLTFEFSGHPTSAYEDMRGQVLKGLGIEEEVAAAHKPKHDRYRPTDKKVTLNFGLAKTQYERGQFAKSQDRLEKVLADDPQYPDAYALNGALHLGLEREGKADAAQISRQAFQQAVDLDGTLPLGLAGLAHFALVDGDPAKALELARQAVAHTEPEELPELAEKAGAPADQSDTAPAVAGKPVAAEATEADKEQGAAAAEGGDRAQRVLARLDQAAAALEAGKAEEAAAVIGEVVDGLVGLPEGPGAKARKMLEMMKKKP
ncbi:MAG: redoxin domain-containing protein [Proteobacteria bacterium]|nr:redoxin domain-containing protein [Pseudomonadota bacterium]